MAGITFEELARRLSAEAKELLRETATMHLAATGDRFFIESRTNRGTTLHFRGDGARAAIERVDGGALADLAGYGLLQLTYTSRGTANYRVGSDGVAFRRYLLEREGAAVEQLDAEVLRPVDGGTFARDHAGAAHHLREAFGLVWSGRTDDETVSEVGSHLRHAIFDLVDDVVGDDGGKPEEPVPRLQAWLAGRDLGERERAVLEALVELADRARWLDQRLNHVRDEAGRGRPPVSWDELRRAAFVTALVCYELSRA